MIIDKLSLLLNVGVDQYKSVLTNLDEKASLFLRRVAPWIYERRPSALVTGSVVDTWGDNFFDIDVVVTNSPFDTLESEVSTQKFYKLVTNDEKMKEELDVTNYLSYEKKEI